MPTKSDRILSYLPGTFRRLPQKSALFAIVDAFGGELLQVENILAAILQAHWVDHADRGSEIIDDLARIGSMYGLAPRYLETDGGECALPSVIDETVEEFRRHLKRYIRTFLEGTVTVQGILRVTAEALSLQIADDYEEMDAWWTCEDDELITIEPRSDDAARSILGIREATTRGNPARPAQVIGTIKLGGGVDLGTAAVLRIKVDDNNPAEVDLINGASDTSAITVDWIVVAINVVLGEEIAHQDGQYLMLTSPTSGSDSRVEVQDVTDDAAGRLLGLAPLSYQGSAVQAASITSAVDLSDGVDLSIERYIRLMIDGTDIFEIEFEALTNVSIDEIANTINNAVGEEIATHNGTHLTLTSVTPDSAGSITFQQPAAQNATARLFGNVNAFYQGQDSQPAHVKSLDLSSGVDLQRRSNIRVSLDGNEVITLNCAGPTPANTRPADIAAAINAAFGETVARQNGRFVTLSSLTTGPAGSVVFEILDEGDATELIFGIKARTFTGAEATAARLVGKVDLSTKPERLNLLARNRLLLSVDGHAPLEIDLREEAEDAGAVTLNELTRAINMAVGADIANHDNKCVTLNSTTTGSQSRLSIQPLQSVVSRRFVTRAKIIDEAARTILGFVSKKAQGVPATTACVTGQKDLSRGVDLRESPFLRLLIDDHTAEINCAGARPRATLLPEIVKEINDAFPGRVALDNGVNLILQSPTPGSGSRITFELSQATDALKTLLDVDPGTTRGQAATGVRLISTEDLSQGIDLSAGASIKLEVDNIATPDSTIKLTEEAAHFSLGQLVGIINQAVGVNVANDDGAHLIIASRQTGSDSQLVFQSAGVDDATEAILGFPPPRTYVGSDAAPARVVGKPTLSDTMDLSTARFLQISVDGDTAVTVDCAANSTNPATAALNDIVKAINDQIPAASAAREGVHLVLTSATIGPAGRITLEPHVNGDARERLFGTLPDETRGEAATPATILGEVDLLSPIDLSERSVLRLVVNGQYPVDIDVSGILPEATSLSEIIAAINTVIPGLASQTDDDRLLLTAPQDDEDSQLELQPLRYLELIEYPLAEEADFLEKAVRHGDTLVVNNKGTADTYATISLTNQKGVAGPTLINQMAGWQLRLNTTLRANETVYIRQDAGLGLVAEIQSPLQKKTHSVPGNKLIVGPLGAQAVVPSDDTWWLTESSDAAAALQLNNPVSRHVIQLRARKGGVAGLHIQVTAVESKIVASSIPREELGGHSTRLVGRVRQNGEQWYLVDESETPIVQLQLGTQLNPQVYEDHVAALSGTLHPGNPPQLIVQSAVHLFDVTISQENEAEDPAIEAYLGVTIGVNPDAEDSLTWQINANPQKWSRLVTAVVLDKAEVLRLPKGRTDWVYLDCLTARFNEAVFDKDVFSGGVCRQRGIFNVSRFSNDASPEKVDTVFASTEPITDPETQVSFSWHFHQAGAFVVNLPVDLPSRFGGRFNYARFGQGAGTRQKYEKAVAEPENDEMNLVNLIQAEEHSLVTADFAANVEIGWTAVTMPFRKPEYLTLGNEERAARLYLIEEGLDGFIEIRAREPGTWGNEIAVSIRPAGPAMYDICIMYEGGRFENAREVVKGKPLSVLTHELLKACPVGILQAKAGGTCADVTRNGADYFFRIL